MSCYAIAIGGTGARCLEALVHLCAAGYGPREELNVLIIDPDAANGNTNRAIATIRAYRDMYAAIYGAVEVQDASNLDKQKFFPTSIRYADDLASDLKVWSPPNQANFQEFLTPKDQALTAKERTLLKLFYTQEELKFRLEAGFRARTNIGSVVMAQSINKEVLEKDPWKFFVEKLSQGIRSSQPGQVFVFGSIFGGTGASGLPIIGRILREHAGLVDNPLFALGAAVMLPYFDFNRPAANGELVALSDYFLLNTQTALKYYQNEKNLVSYHDLYLIGEEKWRSAGDGAVGGRDQNNPSHLIELLAALAAIDFYNDRPTTKSEAGRQVYFYAARNTAEKVEWRDLSVARYDNEISAKETALKKQMIYFTTAAYAWENFLNDLLADPQLASKSFLVPWYYKQFLSRDREKMNLTHVGTRKKLESISQFFEFYLRWLREMHQSGIEQAALQIFDVGKLKTALGINMSALALGLGTHGKRLDYNDFWNLLLETQPDEFQEPVPLLMNLLTKATQQFCDQSYKFDQKT